MTLTPHPLKLRVSAAASSSTARGRTAGPAEKLKTRAWGWDMVLRRRDKKRKAMRGCRRGRGTASRAVAGGSCAVARVAHGTRRGRAHRVSERGRANAARGGALRGRLSECVRFFNGRPRPSTKLVLFSFLLRCRPPPPFIMAPSKGKEASSSGRRPADVADRPAPRAPADARFARIATDPRFARFPKAKAKVEADDRFKGERRLMCDTGRGRGRGEDSGGGPHDARMWPAVWPPLNTH